MKKPSRGENEFVRGSIRGRGNAHFSVYEKCLFCYIMHLKRIIYGMGPAGNLSIRDG